MRACLPELDLLSRSSQGIRHAATTTRSGAAATAAAASRITASAHLSLASVSDLGSIDLLEGSNATSLLDVSQHR
ncbi:hypothetical protein G7Z17_g13075 [Cylindrodendrum hubeiense]|uniref:Uncharacterized protein n=1 Tax=Cylindrodendrum hubeiense TaxID=595255 RepID=A0A9P5GWH2_9HYPO|nr:hypothetical protein G7Z17_g13075 [Cylindrodendrum hubeiense]